MQFGSPSALGNSINRFTSRTLCNCIGWSSKKKNKHINPIKKKTRNVLSSPSSVACQTMKWTEKRYLSRLKLNVQQTTTIRITAKATLYVNFVFFACSSDKRRKLSLWYVQTWLDFVVRTCCSLGDRIGDKKSFTKQGEIINCFSSPYVKSTYYKSLLVVSTYQFLIFTCLKLSSAVQ